MTANVKSIETVYNGYRFRSRLEARWAVFFDAIGAEWEYEPEGFVLRDGTKYLPDFLLKNVQGRGKKNMYIEIKGELSKEDLRKIDLFSQGDSEFLDPDYAIIIFGKIPEEEYIPAREYKYYKFHKDHLEETTEYWDGYYRLDYSKDDNENFYNLMFSEGDYYWTEPKAAVGGGLVLDYPDNPYEYVDEDLTIKAYRKARKARFEHGETPIC